VREPEAWLVFTVDGEMSKLLQVAVPLPTEIGAV
jgi:hypothetical protein